ncbi:N-ethylammeline chlorohydrolase [Paenibacillus sp. BIHB 4019]|uniref:5-methylthioadenosine/S-adenosylhomocysteine deaminase n=1 Tax=Paenibacillus sp. BIHB 4019 TaxID=1870819 RepID=A0A1B2DBL4_9BACL|nr:amidohydrolase [Paenibacillus sp. BIHB 4019]ANY65099.1 N-ethylammeline chlorohydrolase [Paenibacillus sp. BIHB 4019]
MRTLIQNVHILTMKKNEKLFHGELLIENDRIAAIGTNLPEAKAQASKIIDGKGMLAMPGLINAHQHTPMSLLKGFSDDCKLMEWLEHKMLPAEARMTPEDIYWGAKLAMAEMIKSGTTAFADMYVHMNEIAAAVLETGMRASLTRGLVFMQNDGGKRLTEALDLIDRWHGQADGRITTMFGPHAPYTCPPEPLAEIITLAAEKDLPIHIHLAETVEEVAKIKEKYNCSPTAYLHNLGLFTEAHALLAHGVHLTHGDIHLLRGMKGGVAHNPVSNLKLGCGIAPVAALIEAGVTVGLGTDGSGSASTVDMFEGIKAAAWMQKMAAGDPSVFPARQVLEMATAESAKLLRLDQEIGTLEAGKKADLILVNMNKPHLQPVHNQESLLAYAVNGSDVDTTIVNGKLLMQGRELMTIDEEELLKQAVIRARRIVDGI